MKKNIFCILFCVAIFCNTHIYAGTSIMGPTGFLNVVSTEIVGEGVAEFGAHYSSYQLKSDRTSNERRFSFKGNYGLGKNFEVGFEKTSDSNAFISDQGIVLSGKFKTEFTENLGAAFGILVDTDANDYSSAYLTVGAKVAFFGIGVNFGGHSNVFNNMAHFGAYNFDDLKPENVFFMAGAELTFGRSSILLGYNSDFVSVGFRTPLNSGEYVADIGWQSESDYERVHQNLPGMADYEASPFTFGISGRF